MNDTGENIAFLRHRAAVERSLGTNALLCGDDAGKWRVDRANMFDKCADHFAVMESNKVQLEGQIKKLQEDIKELKDKK